MSPDTAKAARVTILLSTYNGSRFLQQQLDSLYEQSCPNIRILARDDGSSDSTRNILDGEQARGRIDVLEGHNNLGPARSFFELLRNAASAGTEYAAFCDQDDVWGPQKISQAVSALSDTKRGVPAMYCSRAEIVDEQLRHVGYTEIPRKIGFGNALVENVAIGCTIVLNRKAIDLICESLPDEVLIHDWWCYLVISCFGNVIFDNRTSIKYRQHGSNTIGVARNILERYERKIRRFFGGATGRLWISSQASSLQHRFKGNIPPLNRQILDNFVATKSSLYRRLRLALSNDVWRQKWSDNLLLRLLILLNRY